MTVFSSVPSDEIDAGAEQLRYRQQGGKKLNAWETLPNSSKRKWREYAAVVLNAAATVRAAKLMRKP